VHAKVGVAEDGDALRVYEILNFAQAKGIFTQGPLLERLRQHFEEFDEQAGELAQPVLCVRPLNDIPGTVGIPVKTGTGIAAAPVIGGIPTGERTVILRFTVGGAHGVAEYRRSTDGGLSFEPPMITPLSGSQIALAAGVSAAFTDDAVTPADTFHAGDEWLFPIHAPSASDAARLDAVEALKREYNARWIHVAGGVKRPFAVACEQILTEMETLHHLPSFIVLEEQSFEEAMPPATPETAANVALHLQGLVDEWDPFVSPSGRVVIVGAQGRYIPGGILAAGGYAAIAASTDPVGEWRNAASFLCARMAAAPVNESPAYVARHRSLTITEIRHWNIGYRDFMDVLHDLGHVVLKVYDDYEGVYIARGRIKADRSSDFQEIPERRRADKMHRLVYRESIPFLNGDSAITNLDYVATKVGAAVSAEMQRPGEEEISGFKIVMDPERKFSTTGVLWADLIMYVGKRFKEIRWRTAFAPAE
jgi:hypothetical protein